MVETLDEFVELIKKRCGNVWDVQPYYGDIRGMEHKLVRCAHLLKSHKYKDVNIYILTPKIPDYQVRIRSLSGNMGESLACDERLAFVEISDDSSRVLLLYAIDVLGYARPLMIFTEPPARCVKMRAYEFLSCAQFVLETRRGPCAVELKSIKEYEWSQKDMWR